MFTFTSRRGLIMKEHNLQETIALLSRTPAALNALLRDLPQSWILSNEGENTWTVFGVVGHLIYADRTDWLQREETILNFGESRPFDPFDREGQTREIQDRSMEQLLDEFVRLRSENLGKLRALNLRQEDLILR